MDQSSEPRAVQLIAIDANRQLYIKEEAIQIIKNLQAKCKNFAVMVVVGKYRTGKSYLINQVLLQNSKGFDVGSTINACTKGLWMWSELIYFTSSKSNEPIPTLLLDTEGIGSVEEEENHDVKIFLLAMLLSSYFIYNSVGTIDDMALQNLGLIVNLTKFLQKADEEVQKDIFDSFPSFLWVLRDFSLKLEDESGNRITPKEYLENALKPLKGFSESIENKNKLRRHIMQFFGERDCFTLVRPVQDEKQLQQLNSLSLDMLRPEFQEQVQLLRKKFSFKVHLKTYRNKPVTPYGFVEMCKHFIESINGGTIPEIQSQWTAICMLEMKRVFEDCLHLYDSLIREFCAQPGITRESLEVRHAIATQKVKQCLEENCLDRESADFKEYKKLLKVELEQRIKQYQDKVQEMQEQELKSLRDSYIYQVQMFKPTNLWDLGEFGQKAMLEFIEQGGAGEHLSTFIKDVWSELIKQLQQEVYAYKTKISQSQDEIAQHQIGKVEFQREAELLRENLATQQREYEAQLIQYRLEIDTEVKKQQSLSAELKRATIVMETRNAEYMAKFKSIESSYQDQLQDKDYAISGMENRLKKALIDADRAQALQRQKEQEVMGEMLQVRRELQRVNEELKEKQDSIQKLRDTIKLNSDQSTELRSSMLSDCSIQRSDIMGFEPLSPRLMNEWKMQKDFLEKQLKTSQSQLDDHKRFNDALIISYPQNALEQKTTEQSQEQNTLITTNNRLGKAVEMAEARCRDLEQQLIKHKKFQKLIKMCTAMECRFCMKQQKTSFFEAHLAVCRKRNTQKSKSSEMNHPHFDVAIHVDMDDAKEFQIQVSQNNSQWVINKTLDDIIRFATQISQLGQQCGKQIHSLEGILSRNEDPEAETETVRLNIVQFLNEISFQKEIRTSSIYEQFFETEQQYPSTSELSMNERSRDDRQRKQKAVQSMDWNDECEDLQAITRFPLKPTQKKSLLQMFQLQKIKESEKVKKGTENVRRSNKHIDSHPK